MKARGEVIGYDELELVSPYEIQALQDLNVMQTINDHATKSTAVENFVLQYKEIDWQNLKRMTAHFGTVLVVEDDVDELELGLDVGGMIPLAGGADG